MPMSFRHSAFAPWVGDFVTWSFGQSDIRRLPTTAEIAAHRGLFALDTVRSEHLAMFCRHAVGPTAVTASSRSHLAVALAELGAPELDADLWVRRFLARRPLEDGNGRCARALRMWHDLRLQDADDAGLLGFDAPALAGLAPRRH
jgi:hypothetical protein